MVDENDVNAARNVSDLVSLYAIFTLNVP